MQIIKYISTYLLTLVGFIIVDFFWLTVVAKKFYQEKIGGFLKQNPNFIAAGLFYILFVFGLFVIIVLPAIEKKSLLHAIIYGGLFGLVAYATYDLTNLATLKDWPIIVTVVDMIWGAVLGATVSTISFYVAKLIIK